MKKNVMVYCLEGKKYVAKRGKPSDYHLCHICDLFEYCWADDGGLNNRLVILCGKITDASTYFKRADG